MPIWRNMPSMPKVRLSSGTIGTMRLPIALSRRQRVRMRTKAMVVEISRSPVPLSWASKAVSGGDLQRPARRAAALGQRAAQRLAPLLADRRISALSSGGL